MVLKLRRRVLECNHLLKNSKHFGESLKGLRVRDSDCWIKVDIQGCYMCGNKDGLIADALVTFEGDEKRLLKDVMYFLVVKQ